MKESLISDLKKSKKIKLIRYVLIIFSNNET